MDNYNRIGELNIFDVAEECYVSRNTIRRFCKQIGYDNFLDLKKDFKHFDYQYKYFTKFHENENYREWYANEIRAGVQEIDEILMNSKLNQIATQIHDSGNVLSLVSYSSSQSIMEFQRPLVLLNNATLLMTNRKMNQQTIEPLTEKDLIITISFLKAFAKEYVIFIKKGKAAKVLVTTSCEFELTEQFDEMYH